MSDVLAVLRQIMDQDFEPDPNPGGGVRIKEGVAEDRRISVEDGEMRHGRKTKSKVINGYKRHVATDLDSKAILACSVLPANRPEHEALPELKADMDAQGIRVAEVQTKAGRQRFRERVPVEHSLARISQRQGNRARYNGARKNTYDTRRAAIIQNLEIAQRRAA